jgi:hypothetical protein
MEATWVTAVRQKSYAKAEDEVGKGLILILWLVILANAVMLAQALVVLWFRIQSLCAEKELHQ